MPNKLIYHAAEKIGEVCVETAFRGWDHHRYQDVVDRLILRPLYGLGCRAYHISIKAGRRCGELVPNPQYTEDGDEPMLVERRSLQP